MKANTQQIERALDAADTSVRLFLLHGPDQSASRLLAQRLATTLGSDAERIDLTPAQLRSDPAALIDEAAAIPMFGGRRYILIEGAGDEIIEAVEALFQAPAAGNPVAVITGTLRKDSALLKRVTAEDAALSFASYAPAGPEADHLAVSLGHKAGLRLSPELGHRLIEAAGSDRAILIGEIDKLALYLDASPERPVDVDHDALDAVGAATEDGNLTRVIDAVLAGNPAQTEAELVSIGSERDESVRIARVLQRRLLALAGIRAGGQHWSGRPGSGDRGATARQAARIPPAMLSRMIDRASEAERRTKERPAAGSVRLEQLLLATSRAIARLR